jgi:hypothetical protein
MRVIDRNNGPAEAPTTIVDSPLGYNVPCTATGVSTDTTIGSNCAVSTSANAQLPGVVRENRRSIWQIGQMQVTDAGPDGNASTTGDNTLFAVQGVFAP